MTNKSGIFDWRTGSVLAAIFAALMLLYYPFLKKLVIDWGNNDDYSHGYFIPLITLYMIYSIRDKLKNLPIRPDNLGLLLLLAGLGQLVVAKIGSELFTQRTSLIIILMGLVLFFLGRQYFKMIWLPLLYLLFMIPLPAIVWNKIAFPMQLFGSFLTEHVIRFLGIPVFREGNVLHLAETTLEVVTACSGLRSLVTMFALGGLLAWISTQPNWKRWSLFFSAAPIAIFANIVRLTGTAILASKFGSEVADGFLHDFSGIVIFIIGLTLLMTVNKLLSVK